MDARRQFASDTYAGICPAAWAALQEANQGHAPAYGDDPWTARAANLLRTTFETDADVYFLLTGTAANSLALAALCQSYHSVLCAESAHIETDECGGPEFASNGTKLITLPAEHGRIAPADLEAAVAKRSDIHFPKPRVLSISQSTEVGTLYRPEQLAALGASCRRQGLRLHLDGARFANAVAALGCTPAELSWKAGVDVLCLGGSKNGAFATEALLFFDRELSREFAWRCKQAGQLISKMRFAAAPWVGLLRDGAWLANAANGNRCARRMEAGLRALGLAPAHPVEANAVFVDLPPAAAAAMHARGWHFYAFIGGAHRLMCSWDTTDADVDAFLADLRGVMGGQT